MFTKDDIHTLIDVVIVDQHVRIYFPDFQQLKNMLSLMKLKPKKRVITSNTPLINSFF